MKKEKTPELIITPYTKNLILVKGDTDALREQLEAIGGGKWDSSHNAWVFPSNKKQAIQALTPKKPKSIVQARDLPTKNEDTELASPTPAKEAGKKLRTNSLTWYKDTKSNKIGKIRENNAHIGQRGTIVSLKDEYGKLVENHVRLSDLVVASKEEVENKEYVNFPIDTEAYKISKGQYVKQWENDYQRYVNTLLEMAYNDKGNIENIVESNPSEMDSYRSRFLKLRAIIISLEGGKIPNIKGIDDKFTELERSYIKQIEDIRAREHKTIVEQALSEGKPVPSEVLAEYPELASLTPTPQAGEEEVLEKEWQDFLASKSHVWWFDTASEIEGKDYYTFFPTKEKAEAHKQKLAKKYPEYEFDIRLDDKTEQYKTTYKKVKPLEANKSNTAKYVFYQDSNGALQYKVFPMQTITLAGYSKSGYAPYEETYIKEFYPKVFKAYDADMIDVYVEDGLLKDKQNAKKIKEIVDTTSASASAQYRKNMGKSGLLGVMSEEQERISSVFQEAKADANRAGKEKQGFSEIAKARALRLSKLNPTI